MSDLSSLFSSKARFRVLRTLFLHPEPIPLRHVAYLAEMPLFSVQRVLTQFVDEGILIRRKKGRFVLFSVNTGHEFHPFLIQLFDLEMKSRIARSSGAEGEKGRRSLDFSRSALVLCGKGRSWISRHSSPKSSVF